MHSPPIVNQTRKGLRLNSRDWISSQREARHNGVGGRGPSSSRLAAPYSYFTTRHKLEKVAAVAVAVVVVMVVVVVVVVVDCLRRERQVGLGSFFFLVCLADFNDVLRGDQLQRALGLR
ncbi:hypothetical protein E2C01_066043 [Portunus trituberculatus]|uniref:Uncharacterized protein n=1 Tax=Portunus trituberculatus TaxID=210409 RepID=A0A5B7HR89_PORTR|nr:hypothetical protein [Portunus trituberculatus]